MLVHSNQHAHASTCRKGSSCFSIARTHICVCTHTHLDDSRRQHAALARPDAPHAHAAVHAARGKPARAVRVEGHARDEVGVREALRWGRG